MTALSHHHQHSREAHHADEAGVAEILDLDAAVLGASLDEMITWAARFAGIAPRRVVDIGAGTGTGTLALAHRFDTAEVVALDRSALMLQRLRTAALRRGLSDRVRTVQADLNRGWPGIGRFDFGWAALSLHHLSDPDRVLGEIRAALDPGGVLAVLELDSLPRFLPEDIGIGRPGLEERCHQAIAQASWNAHPDWQPGLERSGFTGVQQLGFSLDANPGAPEARRYAYAYFRRIRSDLAQALDAADLDTLDLLLTEDDSDGLLLRRDLTVRSSRTVWAARR
ncbi:MAG: class I SAM-dependent methyltransferase [Microbacteriaceae bacterium]